MRRPLKRALAPAASLAKPHGATLLTYHRVGAGTTDELDVPVDDFEAQVRVLAGVDVVALDVALDRLEAGDDRPSVVLTFDDGFADVHAHAWPLLREMRLPFTVFLASGYVGATMRWPGSTARGPAGAGMSWRQLAEMVDSGLCTIGNHTRDHARPQLVDAEQLDGCSADVEQALGVTPQHYADTWGRRSPGLTPLLAARFRSAATGAVGRNSAGADPLRLRRIPVRRTDPPGFYRAKVTGGLLPELAYDRAVRMAKAVGVRG